jgi:hypothetical protein
MNHTFDLILVGLIAGGIMIWLVDRTNKKGYGAGDWEVLRIVLAVVVVLFLALGFAILG